MFQWIKSKLFSLVFFVWEGACVCVSYYYQVSACAMGWGSKEDSREENLPVEAQLERWVHLTCSSRRGSTCWGWDTNVAARTVTALIGSQIYRLSPLSSAFFYYFFAAANLERNTAGTRLFRKLSFDIFWACLQGILHPQSCSLPFLSRQQTFKDP